MEELEALLKKMPERRVLLQLPDGLKHKVEEFVELFRKYNKEVIVDVDPSYGACDVRINEMRAVGAEAIVHVGHAPMFDLPNVYYVEWRRPADVEKVRRALEELSSKGRVCLATAVNFRWMLEELEGMENVVVGGGSWRIPLRGVVLGCDTTACNVDADLNAFVGDGHFHPLAIEINTGRPTYRISPDGKVERVSYERFLRRRLALVGSVDGKRVGIIVSSKIGQNRNPLAQELAREARKRGYEVNLYVSDYMDPLYLLGLPDDFFVYTGCPRVPLDDWERYEKPLLTPEEFLYKLGLLKKYSIGWITALRRSGSGASRPG